MPRTLLPAVAAALLLCAFAPAAHAAAPCAPGTALTPKLMVLDPADSNTDRNLTATHDIVIYAEWEGTDTTSADDATAHWSGPAGIPMFTSKSRGAKELGIDGNPAAVAFQPPAAGPLPVTLTWDQVSGTRNAPAVCTASFITTLQISAPKRFRVPAPRARNESEFQWMIDLPRNTALTPFEVRFRAVRGAHLPGARVRFKVAKLPSRPTDPGTASGRAFSSGNIGRLRVEPSGSDKVIGGLMLTFNVLHRVTNPKLGYEIQILQGGKRVARLRVVAKCDSFTCMDSSYRFQR